MDSLLAMAIEHGPPSISSRLPHWHGLQKGICTVGPPRALADSVGYWLCFWRPRGGRTTVARLRLIGQPRGKRHGSQHGRSARIRRGTWEIFSSKSYLLANRHSSSDLRARAFSQLARLCCSPLGCADHWQASRRWRSHRGEGWSYVCSLRCGILGLSFCIHPISSLPAADCFIAFYFRGAVIHIVFRLSFCCFDERCFTR